MRGKGFTFRRKGSAGFTLLRSIKVNRSGFTLVELLVTISILAILSSIAIISFSNIQKNTRDAKRKSDLATIQAALEQYHADWGNYPSSDYDFTILVRSDITLAKNGKVYLQSAPQDPLDAGYGIFGGYYYTYLSYSAPAIYDTECNLPGHPPCVNYCLYAKLENTPSSPSLSGCLPIAYFSLSNYAVRAP